RKLLGVLVRTDHDVAVDRHPLEGEAGAGERGVLGRLHVGPAEPACAGESRTLGDARERLALAGRPRVVDVGHGRSAASITSPITWSIVRSTFAFSTTGTPSRRARPATYPWMRRMSSSRSRYLSIARRPPVALSRTWKCMRCTSSSA